MSVLSAFEGPSSGRFCPLGHMNQARDSETILFFLFQTIESSDSPLRRRRNDAHGGDNRVGWAQGPQLRRLPVEVRGYNALVAA